MSPSERTIWIDGKLVPWSEATIHVLSHALQRGALVFDYMSLHSTPAGAAVFRMGAHLERFIRSCELLGLPLRLTLAELAEAVRETARANPGARSIKISAYIPSIEVELVPQNDHVAVAVAAYDVVEDIIKSNPGRFHWRDEIRLHIETERRNRHHDILSPQAKVSAGYAPLLLAKWRARREGYDEIVLLDEDGYLAETPTTNLFLVDSNGTLRTPPSDGVLHGVTRASILELAGTEGIEAVECKLQPEDLLGAAEVFLAATTAGAWPVISVDGRNVGDGRPGPTTLRLRERLRAIASGEDPSFGQWLDPIDP